jgi:uncharacterized membrane protein YphA (DoxX/SURF4 family)
MKALALKPPRSLIIDVIVFLIIALFVYAAVSKILEFDEFRAQIGKSPLITKYSDILAVVVPAIEILIAVSLIFDYTRMVGLYASFFLMAIFTMYIAFILLFSPYVPCSCGGVLGKMGWTAHLIFNAVFTIMALAGIGYLNRDGLAEISTSIRSRKLPILTKKQTSYAVLCFAIGAAILIGLYFVSPLSYDTYRGNFERKFIKETPLVETKVFDLKYNSFYFAGATKNEIYLGNSSSPFLMLKFNTALTDSQHVAIKVKLDSIMEPGRFKIAVDSPNFYVMHGLMPVLLKGRIDDWSAEPLVKEGVPFFSDAVPIAQSSMAYRYYSKSNEGYELGKGNPAELFKSNFDLLNRQHDGIFSLDGKLSYDKKTNSIVYVHFYRNELVVADTTLTLRFRGHSIDTFSRAVLKVAKISGSEKSMLAAPPQQVNGLSTVNNGLLFIQSNVMGKNENEHRFLSNRTIDVYSLKNGKYISSFYLPLYKSRQIKDFIFSSNKIFVLYDQYLVSFNISG